MFILTYYTLSMIVVFLCSQPGSGTNEYNLWVAPDNMNSIYDIGKHSGHFHFFISGLPTGLLKLHFKNVSPHCSLYKFDMRPVYRCKSTNNKWTRVRQSVTMEKVEDLGNLHIEHNIEIPNDKIYFCFTYPYTYEMVQQDMKTVDDYVVNYSVPDSIYCAREVLIRTPEGRNVDLVTISSVDGICNSYSKEEDIPGEAYRLEFVVFNLLLV